MANRLFQRWCLESNYFASQKMRASTTEITPTMPVPQATPSPAFRETRPTMMLTTRESIKPVIQVQMMNFRLIALPTRIAFPATNATKNVGFCRTGTGFTDRRSGRWKAVVSSCENCLEAMITSLLEYRVLLSE